MSLYYSRQPLKSVRIVHPVYATFIRLGRQVLQVKRRQEREYATAEI